MAEAPKDAVDLCKKLLQFNPDKRCTAEEALRHPYVSRFHNTAEEISLNYDVVPPLSDDVQLTVDEYRAKLYEVCVEIEAFWGITIPSELENKKRKTVRKFCGTCQCVYIKVRTAS